MMLKDLLIETAQRMPEAVAVRGDASFTHYGELDALANRAARALRALGLRQGDRVATWAEKSPEVIATMQGALRLGAAYVPIDPLSPASRALKILKSCDAAAMLTTAARAKAAREVGLDSVPCLTLDGGPGADATWDDVRSESAGELAAPAIGDHDLAYILYTSGSTGEPKGVCISQRNALAFIDWAVGCVGVRQDDRLANHAGFHFDLSVFDLYAAFAVGASVSPIPERMAFVAPRLVDWIDRHAITLWYSVPSALILMMDHGGLLERRGLCLRNIIFAGEPFPPKQLRRLQQAFAGVRLFNFYGPTETNVCTFHTIDSPLGEDVRSIPIGRAASGDRVWAVTAGGRVAQPGEEGELYVEGPTVMLGYWGQPSQVGPYATGDVVRCEGDGQLVYVGRRDHMVKVHGHRVEPGEIEAALQLHPAVARAAVTVTGSGITARLVAHVVSATAPPPSLIELKGHCAKHLPRHMIIDELRCLEALPQTPNGKIDRRRLCDGMQRDRREQGHDESADYAC